MERLTKRIDGEAVFHECHGTCGTCDGAMCFCVQPMVDRLAAYEDAMPLERTQELAQAERDGRLVVLTCKVGDTVFCVVNGCLWPEAECPEGSSSCDTCRENKKTVIENKLDCIESVVIASEHWGETVFATLKEAEAAVDHAEGN